MNKEQQWNFKSLVMIIFFLMLVLYPVFVEVPTKINLQNMMQLPSMVQLFGTDNLGRDLLTRLSQAFLQTVVPTWLVVSASIFLGVFAAICSVLMSSYSALWKGINHFLFITFVILSSIPLGIAVFAWSLFQTHVDFGTILLPLFVLIAIKSYLLLFEVYHRDEKLGYWQSHQMIGGSVVERLVKYGICSHWRETFLEYWVFCLNIAVTIEASLSFIGFGVQEPQPSYGNILSSHFSMFLHGEWHVIVFTSFFIFMTVSLPKFLFQIKKF